ncbi:MAG: TIGR03960 family B12-binding radical SAM protein [Planctomycetes bacterium]|nr:TIGR03960 family B12-binding radical SAM protein [Planctomycetota bacterium]
MSDLQAALERILPHVQMPHRYLGGEWNQIVKNHRECEATFCIAFPDTYEVGMSCLGTSILYHVVNADPRFCAERSYTPWPDMEARLRAAGLPLYSHETKTPLRDFDAVGFSIQHEMCFTNILTMLDLAGIPLESKDRTDRDPLVIAGGPGSFTPEPVADFIDVFLIGDGEEATLAFLALVSEMKASGLVNRRERLLEIARRLPYAYVPGLYRVEYREDGTLGGVFPTAEGVPATIVRTMVKDFDNAAYPTKPVLSFGDAVFNRIALEIMRGCPYKCRFCQSTTIKHFVRYRSVDRLVALAEETYANTGFDEISLTSLSTSDYPDLDEVMMKLTARFKSRRVGLSFPSLRVGEQIQRLPKIMTMVRKAGLTLAPETATERMRHIVDKRIKDQDLLDAAKAAYAEGWNLIKLYFMIGVPMERREDLEACVTLGKRVSQMGREAVGRPGNVNVTISPFIPKGHTPFQWERMNTIEEFDEKTRFIRDLARHTRIHLKAHSGRRAVVEAMFSRGDRRLGRALLEGWKRGCRFDSWDELYRHDLWMEAFQAAGTGLEFFALRARKVDEVLPWSHIDIKLSVSAFATSRKKAYQMDGATAAVDTPGQPIAV